MIGFEVTVKISRKLKRIIIIIEHEFFLIKKKQKKIKQQQVQFVLLKTIEHYYLYIILQ